MIRMLFLLLLLATVPAPVLGQRYSAADGSTRVALVKMPYRGARNVPELSTVPDYLEAGGVEEWLRDGGAILKPIQEIALNAQDERQYGEWQRLALANGHLSETIAENERQGFLSIGLLANCSSLWGMLAGLQHAGPGQEPLRVGLVFIDAHGDFNTPETTLSGMLGGMPLAVSAGLALERLRVTSGLDPALPIANIVLGAARDLDPLEQGLIDETGLAQLSVDDFRDVSPRLHAAMQRLTEISDIIYVHIDMDVLDPKEVAGHPLTVPNGPTSAELARALTAMFEYEKVAALGLASTPANEFDPDGVSLAAAYRLIEGALAGVRAR